ncbi:4-hydroxybenzoate polyprenyltransferase-like prenyltransferase [Desulfosporosinus acidiphilus SJ4]|uniref:4-hydroxybenzoate polyprenyltransferase-like prenyltransferase n=1 Tax=Desulfosporosinus acidiphilus (strain DSM 22704 / JCM 16185 / SJ4) TaxID=646529 RepID=I4DB70_DESAJ|nr:decaprenyl-phosphate phosphoribosyltransferase [Desulfosporosinus acidiphilus]AFM43044.1 4-hydroxybenzoate polyprenyltransferase-like prenyltransferase [Desulfosporosinus acidiphilus SJ4]
MNFLKLLRPHQWIKNSFVLLGIMFSKQWDLATLFLAFVTFGAFCCIASSIYVFNDLLDIEADRQHPTKKTRPLASRLISPRSGWMIAGGLVLTALLLAAVSGPWVVLFIVMYAALNIAYTLRLKQVAVLDVFIISAGFMLRILAGTIGLGIAPSSWLLLCGFMLSLFLGFAKRRAEFFTLENSGLSETKNQTRQVLRDYSPMMIDQFMAVSSACTILCYGLYTVNSETVARYGTTALIYTLPFVVYGVFRYIFLLHRRGKGNDTALDLYSDPHLLVTVLIWGLVTVVIIA